MFQLLEFIGNLFNTIVDAVMFTLQMLLGFLVSIVQLLDFASGTGPAQYLPSFIIPAFVFLCIFGVIKVITNRD